MRKRLGGIASEKVMKEFTKKRMIERYEALHSASLSLEVRQ
jgi:hypothetical protein